MVDSDHAEETSLLPSGSRRFSIPIRPQRLRAILVLTLITVFVVLSTKRVGFSTDQNATLEKWDLISTRPAVDAPLSSLDLPRHEFAFATFIAAPAKRSKTDEDDHYFIAARMLAYQLLHDPETKTASSIPFLVLVTEDVSESKRVRLEADGATIVPVDRLNVPWLTPKMSRWRDVISKLHLFELTQYQRILFLDADMLIFHQLDAVFKDAAVQVQTNRHQAAHIRDDEGPQPEEYLFAGISDQMRFDHPYPPRINGTCNAGFFVVRPSQDLFQHYLNVLQCEGRFRKNLPEQNMFNYVHRPEGNMPWTQLEPTWNVNKPNMSDYQHDIKTLHMKWWHPKYETGLHKIALEIKAKMEESSKIRDAVVDVDAAGR